MSNASSIVSQAATVIALGAMLAAPAFASAGQTPGATVRVAGDRLELAIALDGATPVEWRACHPSCASADAGAGTSVRLVAVGDPTPIRLVVSDLDPPVDLEGLRFSSSLTEDERARIATFQGDLSVPGVRLVKSFEISRDGYEVVMTARMVGPDAGAFMSGRRLTLELAAGAGLMPRAAGFTAMLERMSRVIVTRRVRVIRDDSREPTRLRAGDWMGFRSRFWTLLTRSDGAGDFAPEPGAGAPLGLTDEPGRLSWRYTFYGGPLENGSLTRADPRLGRLVFSGLWFWLRPLTFGVQYLLRGLTGLIGHPGAAIIALAVSVEILLSPLTVIAEWLRERVSRIRSRRQPGADAMQAAYRGAEGAGLAGFVIQLPVLVAVFAMLAESFTLQNASFLWIRDLSRPDALARLPVCVPFLGCDLNVLPFLMSGVSLAILLRVDSGMLTPSLVRRARRKQMAVTALFFLVFYTFPAGMVLYWTSISAFRLLSQEAGRLWRRA